MSKKKVNEIDREINGQSHRNTSKTKRDNNRKVKSRTSSDSTRSRPTRRKSNSRDKRRDFKREKQLWNTPESRGRDWNDVSADAPCPICGKKKWCSVSHDENTVLCRRESKSPTEPSWVFENTKSDTNGNWYHIWQHLVADDTQTRKAISKGARLRDSPRKRAAKPSTLHHVYHRLLRSLKLPAEQQEALEARGFSPQECKRRGYGYLSESRTNAVNVATEAGLEKHFSKVPGFYRNQDNGWRLAGPSGILVPVRNLEGQITALKVRVDHSKGANKYCYLSSKKHGGPSPGSPVHVPLHDDQVDYSEVRVTEGELKADLATSRSGELTISVPGAGTFKKAIPVLQELGTQRVVLAFDVDFQTKTEVAAAFCRTVRHFSDSFEVVVEVWPEEHGKGIDDVLEAGHTPQRLTGNDVGNLVRELENRFGPVTNVDKPKILITTQEHLVNDQAVAALAADDRIYKRGGALVRIVADDNRPDGIIRPEGVPHIAAIPQPLLREMLSGVANWRKRSRDKFVPAHPPEWSVKAILARGEWGPIRPLEGIITGPMLRADGSVLAENGYDQNTGLICQLGSLDLPQVPDEPDRKQVREAVECLKEVVTDFPFALESHRAVWIAFVLTMVARFAFGGNAPLSLFDSNTPGTGKGLLTDAASIIATGRPAAKTADPQNDEETRKRITAIALAGDQLIHIDNIVGTLGTPALDAALTATVWKDRILNRSEMVELPLTATWCATGNNVALTTDMTRRVVHCRLDTKFEHPEERHDFKHPNLLEWVGQNRGKLVAAALTVLRGFCAAGRPDQNLAAWGSYEEWSDLIRSAVVWAGLPDPAETRQALRHKADTENQALMALLRGLQLFDPEGAGLTASEITSRIWDEKSEAAEMIREALSELCPTHSGGLPNPRQMGSKFRYLTNRVVGGNCLDFRTRNNTRAWLAREVDTGSTGTDPQSVKSKKKTKKTKGMSAGSRGSKGSIHTPSRENFSDSDKSLTQLGADTSRNPSTPRSASDGVSNDTEVF